MVCEEKLPGNFVISVTPIFAGGTSVSSALECPEEEKRTIVSLDTSQMVCDS